MVRFAEDDAVANGANSGERRDEREFGAPAKTVIECAAKQRRKSRSC